MSIIAQVQDFIARYASVDQVLQSSEARLEMSSILVKLDIDPNTACNGCVRGKYIHLQSIVNKNSKTMSEKPGYPGRRYVLPEGKKVRPFGSPIYYDNSTLTDEMILAYEKKFPGFIKNFIDTEEQSKKKAAFDEASKAAEPPIEPAKKSGLTVTSSLPEPAVKVGEVNPPEKPSAPDVPEIIDYEQKDPERYHGYMEGFTNDQLRGKYKELVGEDPPGRPTKRVLVFAIMKEEDAINDLHNEQFQDNQ